jgi:hypothetical protein
MYGLICLEKGRIFCGPPEKFRVFALHKQAVFCRRPVKIVEHGEPKTRGVSIRLDEAEKIRLKRMQYPSIIRE